MDGKKKLEEKPKGHSRSYGWGEGWGPQVKAQCWGIHNIQAT